MEQQTSELVLKALNEDGSFEGYAAVYGNVDAHGDRIMPGAFKDSIGQQVPILFAHKTDVPVGMGTLEDSPEGLKIKGNLLVDTQAGRDAYTQLKAGVLKGLSVGFQLLDKAYQGAVRVIRKGNLKEVSLVVFPANQLAQVTAVKQESGERCALAALDELLR